MPRSLWQGAISFGLIYVPVDLYSASKEGGLSLHLLDSRDFSPVGYKRVNKSTGKEVDWDHIVKGYEYQKGKFVALSDADFKHANVKATQTVDISTFTEASQIAPKYFETPYYLLPKKGGEKVYALLRQALKASGKVAVATLVMRGRQHLCAIVPIDEALMLLTLRFADEVLPPVQLKTAAKATVSSEELSMATKLVDQMSGPFQPHQFKDTYQQDLLRRVKEKIRKKQTHSLELDAEVTDDRPKAQVIDLMDALRKSLTNRSKPGIALKKKPARAKRRA